MADDAAPLAQACLTHLAREEDVLRSALATLGAVRAAALAGDRATLDALYGRQEEIARQTAHLGHERQALRARIGALLHIPIAEATLALLAARVGGAAGDDLLSAGQRTRRLATDVDRLNNSNAALLGYCLGFARRVLRDLTGGGTPAESYGPDGTAMESPCGSLLSARG
jgi:hypothetical protein